MMPKFNHKDLFEYINTNEQKEEEWFLIILANPHSRGVAIKEIYDSFIYLNERTEDVPFFMPGYWHVDGKIQTYSEYFPSVTTCDQKQIVFKQEGFLETIKWLESKKTYTYSEYAELIFIRHKRTSEIDEMEAIDGGFDLNRIVSFNIDELAVQTNLPAFFRDCNKVVKEDMSIWELQQKYSSRIATSIALLETKTPQRSVNVFIAGSKKLQSLRQIARSALMGITNKSQKGYIIKALTFEDFAVSFTNEGRQIDYLEFIKNEADYAIFLLDSKVGGITCEEFQTALSSYKSLKKPKIFVFNKLYSQNIFARLFRSESEDFKKIKSSIDAYNQYYTDFCTEKELELLISNSFSTYL